jgi:hypothetical protein
VRKLSRRGDGGTADKINIMERRLKSEGMKSKELQIKRRMCYQQGRNDDSCRRKNEAAI